MTSRDKTAQQTARRIGRDREVKVGRRERKGVVENVELGKVDRADGEVGRDPVGPVACHGLVGACARVVGAVCR